MTVIEKAKAIKAAGMKKADLFGFFEIMQKDILDHIGLFESIGCDTTSPGSVWDIYEEWQTDGMDD